METCPGFAAYRLFYGAQRHFNLPPYSRHRLNDRDVLGATGLAAAVLIDHRYDLEKAIRGVGHVRARILKELPRDGVWWRMHGGVFHKVFAVFHELKSLRESRVSAQKFCDQNPWRKSQEEPV